MTLLCRHLSRSTANWDSRVLVLVDSLVTLGCMRKMRSSSAALQRQVRCVAVLALATGIRPLLRWLPSAWNPADGPSRGCPVGPAPETLQKHSEEASEAWELGVQPGGLRRGGHL